MKLKNVFSIIVMLMIVLLMGCKKNEDPGGLPDVIKPTVSLSDPSNNALGVAITLSGGAQAKNIFWQVAGQATFGTTSHFEGIILSMTGITFQTGASFKGRALAQTAVVLDGNAVILP